LAEASKNSRGVSRITGEIKNLHDKIRSLEESKKIL